MVWFGWHCVLNGVDSGMEVGYMVVWCGWCNYLVSYVWVVTLVGECIV